MKNYIQIILCFIVMNCNNSPIDQGEARKNVEIEYFYLDVITTNSARISWKCSTSVAGTLAYQNSIGSVVELSLYPSEFHQANLNNLNSNTEYSYSIHCGDFEKLDGNTFFQSFRTLESDEDIISVKKRSIWIFGGLSNNNKIVSQVDYFDPVGNKWYSNETELPTPRVFSQVVAIEEKIFVIGGLKKVNDSLTISKAVEVYDIRSKSWSTYSEMPNGIQGGIVGFVDDSIFIIAGSISNSIADITADRVYKLDTKDGATGTWTNYLLSDYATYDILQRVDMSGCMMNGNLIYTAGRSTDGTVRSTTDSYSTAVNSITSLSEASKATASFGSASACYVPQSTDPYPTDSKLLLIVGGSATNNSTQPASISAVDLIKSFQYLNPITNTMSTGTNYPKSVYSSAMEISYINRKAYVFGGELDANVISDSVYSIDLNTIATDEWDSELSMPIARFGHRAVVLGRK